MEGVGASGNLTEKGCDVVALPELVVLVLLDCFMNASDILRVDSLLPLDMQLWHDVLPNVHPGVTQK